MNYEELYKRAILHIANLESEIERTNEINKFYENEIEILNERIKQCLA